MHATFAQALPYQGGGYGVAVLSREKPLSVFKTPLPGAEPRVLLLCEFKDCWFGTTHLSLQETNRLACTLVTFGGVATFTVSKMTADPAFEEKMYKLFSDDGIAPEVEGSDFYAN